MYNGREKLSYSNQKKLRAQISKKQYALSGKHIEFPSEVSEKNKKGEPIKYQARKAVPRREVIAKQAPIYKRALNNKINKYETLKD